MNNTIRYRSDIDGLRTLAVLAVIVFHLDNDALAGGYLGVDVFFVISGYLITAIIYKQMTTGNFSLIGFWKRRIKRLYPALMVMVGAVLVTGAFLLVRPERTMLPMQALAAILSFENILLWKTTGGYWATASENIPLLHAWSLSLEEQFYICFPILLLILYKAAHGKETLLISLALLASLGLSFYATPYYQSASFYLLPTRMWELLGGSVLAILHVNETFSEARKRANLFQLLGLICILIAYTAILEEHLPITLIHALPCIGTLILIQFGSARGLVRDVLSFKPTVYVGKISYSLYLWHWPVMVFLKYLSPNFNIPLALSLTLLLSVLSYHFVESPFRYGYKKPRRALAITLAAVSCCFLPLFIWSTSPIIKGLGNLDSEASLTRAWEFEKTNYIRQKRFEQDPQEIPSGINLCVLGSSHARVICKPIADFTDRHSLSFLSLVTSGTGITSDNKSLLVPDAAALNNTRLSLLSRLSVDIVLVAGKWNDEARYEGFDSRLQERLSIIASHANQVYVLGQVPEIKLPRHYKNALRKYLVALHFSGEKQTLKLSEEVESTNGRVEGIVNQMNRTNIEYLDPYPLFLTEDGSIKLVQDDQFLYSDYHHVNDLGASLIFNQLLAPRINDRLLP